MLCLCDCLLFKSKSEHFVVLDEFPLVDHAIGQHGPPGAPQVVVSVEDISRGEDCVSGGHLASESQYNEHLSMSSQAHLEPSNGQGCFLLVEELGQHKVPRLHDGTEVHVQVGELVMLQGGAIGPLGVSNPLVKIVIRVGKVLNIEYLVFKR